ncbi:TRAP transporter small permease subunit [Roseobacter sp. N2S]|uniref:TRAP transporter small permease n=1 Tax=Roseobacter sp. N2S TaxID=2663844 RepID=UPI002864A0DB|nr:TRAP transporter small permease subunit [Roseobacter sp. N2S]MDR6264497.1 TRAP-type C4-dicarboxylate transport system permease small subunit [Roseobacter sp. N2S]
MDRMMHAAGWLHRRAENVLALMIAVMFGAFIVQVASRYLFNFSLGGASELTIIMWLWLVLWGAGFVLREREEIRFDVVYGLFGLRGQRAMTAISAIALLALYGYSLPAVWDYVTFMRIQKTSYLDIRFDWLFSIYILFVGAVLIRYLAILFKTLGGCNILKDIGRSEKGSKQ